MECECAGQPLHDVNRLPEAAATAVPLTAAPAACTARPNSVTPQLAIADTAAQAAPTSKAGQLAYARDDRMQWCAGHVIASLTIHSLPCYADVCDH